MWWFSLNNFTFQFLLNSLCLVKETHRELCFGRLMTDKHFTLLLLFSLLFVLQFILQQYHSFNKKECTDEDNKCWKGEQEHNYHRGGGYYLVLLLNKKQYFTTVEAMLNCSYCTKYCWGSPIKPASFYLRCGRWLLDLWVWTVKPTARCRVLVATSGPKLRVNSRRNSQCFRVNYWRNFCVS